MTDELDDVDASGTTLQPPIAELGVEAQAEYQRLRSRLGLRKDDEEPGAGLPSLGRYRLERELGRGGMGVVYLAQDPEVGRPVAIKLVRGLPFAATTKLRARLLREAKVLGKLTHPNVVRIYDVGSHEGEVYLAMEYVDGQTLHEWQQGRERDEIVDAYVQAARGLAAAHDVGIVHRDFKPDNVFVARDGRILVGDFGLAGAVVPEHETEPTAVGSGPEGGPPSIATKTGALLGTPAYMAPEQLRGDVATPSSDQFALCVSLWEAITTRRPFEGEDAPRLLEAIERGVPASAERLPKKLHRVLRRGLAANPDDRYEDIRALCEALERLRSRPTVMIGALALVGVAVGTWVLATSQTSRVAIPEPPPEPPCALEEAVARVERNDAWPDVRKQLEDTGLVEPLQVLETHLARIDAEARDLCARPHDVHDEARSQHLQLWLEDLEGFLETAEDRDDAALLQDIAVMARARLSAPPPRPLAPEVVDALQGSRRLERLNRLDEALTLADEAIARAGERDVELAVAQQRRGRVLTLDGRHSDAMKAYRRARISAYAEAHDDGILEIELLVARTAVMRLEELDLGGYALEAVEGLLDDLDEPSPSLRWAEYQELQAAVLKRTGEHGAALASQWLALTQQYLLGTAYEQGRGHINLATIHERRGDFERARLEYERALKILAPAPGAKASPEWFQAAYNLGRWLAYHAKTEDERQRGRKLIESARQESDDHYAVATSDLLTMALFAGDSSTARHLATELRKHLREEPPASSSRAFDCWQPLALEAAFAGDLAALDEAVAAAYREAAQIERDGSQPLDELELRRGSFEASLAFALEDVDLARAATFARRAKERLASLPETVEIKDMLLEVDRILARKPD